MELEKVLRKYSRYARVALDDFEDYLASPEGRRVRKVLAAGLMAAAPMLTWLPPFRASRIGRFLAMAGGAALMVKAAELIRDWEPRQIKAA
jgi:hypothetical protein